MDELGTMKKFDSFDKLIDDKSIVDIFEYFLPNSIMQISFHKFENQVEVFIIFSTNNIMQLDDIGMRKLMQKNYFSKSPLSIGGMLESIKYFFESQSLSCLFIGSLPNMPISSTSHLFNQRIFSQNMCLYFLTHYSNNFFTNLNNQKNKIIINKF